MSADSHPLDLRDASQAGVYRVMCADVDPLLVLAAQMSTYLKHTSVAVSAHGVAFICTQQFDPYQFGSP